MKVIVRATRVGTIADLDKRDDLILATDSQNVEYVKDFFGNRPAVQDFDGFFLLVADGDYQEVYGFEGSVPELRKPIWKITRTFSESKPKTKTTRAKSKGRGRGGSNPTSLRGIR